MDSNGILARPFDESLIRELPQLQSLRIAPLRQPVSSRILSIPSPLEPNASGVRDPNSISKPNNSAAILPTRNDSNNPGVTDGGSHAAAVRSKRNDLSGDSLATLELPPKPILPSFVNLRALERFPYSSFDEDSHQTRKRRRLDVQADSFGEHLQLPIPQSQKEQRPPPFGPFAILNGLNEPPPNAALLPPIEAGSITQLLTKPSRDHSYVEPTLLTANSAADAPIAERREGRIEEILDSPVVEKTTTVGRSNLAHLIMNDTIVTPPEPPSDEPEADKDARASSIEDNNPPLSPKSRGRSRKNLRKWTDEETTALLRGVVKCGIGNWTAILAQPELKFNKRSASNLKDRFRVCCPWAYRAADPNEATKKLRDTLAEAVSRAEAEGSDGIAGKIRLPHPWLANLESGNATSNLEDPSPSTGSPSTATDQKSSKSSTKNSSSSRTTPTLSSRSKSTLASLGIPEPHFTMKSRRRSRCPFTAAEDEALLKGYAVHGFQWTLIQQDKRLSLSHRRATDLRDRFRTKFPHAYRDGGSVSGKTLHNQSKDAAAGLKDGGKQNPQYTKQSSASRHPRKPDNAEQTTLGPIDPALSPPAPPQGMLEGQTGTLPNAVFQFPLDENSANGQVDGSWAENTLAPMLWDELA